MPNPTIHLIAAPYAERTACGLFTRSGGIHAAWPDLPNAMPISCPTCLATDDPEGHALVQAIHDRKAGYCDHGPFDACRCLVSCPHLSMSGDEGPVLDLGRWPVIWRCDSCGARIEYDTTPLTAQDAWGNNTR